MLGSRSGLGSGVRLDKSELHAVLATPLRVSITGDMSELPCELQYSEQCRTVLC